MGEHDILHVYRNPIRIWDLGEGFTMMAGANAAAIIFEVGRVQSDSAVVIVHAMRPREVPIGDDHAPSPPALVHTGTIDRRAACTRCRAPHTQRWHVLGRHRRPRRYHRRGRTTALLQQGRVIPSFAAGADASASRGAAMPDERSRPQAAEPGGDEPFQVAILVAMSVDPQMALKDVKNHLSEVVDQVEREHDRVVVTKHGRPAAVMLSVDDLASLEESLEIMGRRRLVAQIRDSLAELDQDQADVLTKEQALELLRR